jgi:catechol 2,3-dioxygenase-like lactoylglutathione lyase family enzyme
MPMRRRSSGQWWGVVLEAPDARALAQFYAGLLGWTIAKDEPGWVTVAPPDGVAYLAFQTSQTYAQPVWPPADDHQQMMMHLDIEVGALDEAVADAVGAGAILAEHQPQDDVRVLFDPAGHPFCLYLGE